MDFRLPGVGVYQIGEALVGSAEIGKIDQVGSRRERREVGQRMLRCTEWCRPGRLLYQSTTGTELAARREAHIDLAVGGVLDVFLQVQLHDRIAARRTENIGGGNGHDVLGRSLALTLFLGSLRHRNVRPQCAGSAGHHGNGKCTCASQLEKIAPLDRSHFVLDFLVCHRVSSSL
jgi:hypothetical protein